jgi:hypothetical protein
LDLGLQVDEKKEPVIKIESKETAKKWGSNKRETNRKRSRKQ